MNKALLREALKFEHEKPVYSSIEKLYKRAKSYQTENDCIFIKAKYRSRATILNERLFFEFITEDILDNGLVESFEDIRKILNARSRKENIEATGDSKSSYIKVFDRVVVFQSYDNDPVLYKDIDKIKIEEKILAVENGETFLDIYSIMSKFGFNYFVYIGGFSNSLTREFLKDKNVVFYLDYDIEAIRIYDSFQCKSKSFFKHPDIEQYFEKYHKKKGNQSLFLKQRKSLPATHPELQWLIKLFEDYCIVIEHEAFI